MRKHQLHRIPAMTLLVVSALLLGQPALHADEPSESLFAESNKREVVGHEYSATVKVPRTLLGSHRIRFIVMPARAPSMGWVQAARVLTPRSTKTVFLGTRAPTNEKFELGLIAVPRGNRVPEGAISLERLDEMGVMILDAIPVHRLR